MGVDLDRSDLIVIPAEERTLRSSHADYPQNENNAKYAVFRARDSADAAHILGPVREAQGVLHAMEQLLKASYEAMQNSQAEQQQDDQK